MACDGRAVMKVIYRNPMGLNKIVKVIAKEQRQNPQEIKKTVRNVVRGGLRYGFIERVGYRYFLESPMITPGSKNCVKSHKTALKRLGFSKQKLLITSKTRARAKHGTPLSIKSTKPSNHNFVHQNVLPEKMINAHQFLGLHNEAAACRQLKNASGRQTNSPLVSKKAVKRMLSPAKNEEPPTKRFNNLPSEAENFAPNQKQKSSKKLMTKSKRIQRSSKQYDVGENTYNKVKEPTPEKIAVPAKKHWYEEIQDLGFGWIFNRFNPYGADCTAQNKQPSSSKTSEDDFKNILVESIQLKPAFPGGPCYLRGHFI